MNRFVRFLAIILSAASAAHAGKELPVFIGDNHAETAGWITRQFDLDDPHILVLVDAHSDASAVERSEDMREEIRRVPSENERASRIEEWRKSGRLQAFNWIEPLMPRPLDHVLWLAAPTLDDKQLTTMTMDAVASLDGRLEVEPRSAGSFARRWETFDLRSFRKWQPGGQKIILAIDLDFFAGMEPPEREAGFETIWKRAMDWPGLSGVAFAVSRPWLTDDAEADALVALTCAAVSRTRGAVLEIDASLDDRPDESAKAAELIANIPRWDAADTTIAVRAIWLSMRDRLRIIDRKRNWQSILDSWTVGQIRCAILPDHGEPDCDGGWRYQILEAPSLRVHTQLADATGRVRWFALGPVRDTYDLLPETGLGKSFAASPGRWIYETRRSLGVTTDFALAAERWMPETPGRVRIEAELETKEGWLPLPPIELRLADGTGFRGALSECFRMPYVFGIAGVGHDDLTGVETGWGSDCSNFLIHAWRRNGLRLEWGDPGRLRAQLDTQGENLTLKDSPPITPEWIERGIAIDFGRHVAAVWEDREPLGVLGGNDLAVHHLGGFPEVIDLATLAKNHPVFALRAPHISSKELIVRIAGDVVMAGENRLADPEFEEHGEGVFLANLEGVPSMKEPEHRPVYDFRFPANRLNWLKECGIDAVSLANNHAGDAGREGLVEALGALRQAGIGVCGAGTNASEACRPWRMERNGVRLAVFGICIVDSLTASADASGVACLPAHADLLETEIRNAMAGGEQVVILLHGGDEYQGKVNDDQRRWARWLVRRGACVIAGAHPHVLQREERHGGAVVAYSLGNAVYPAQLKGADSGKIRNFRIVAP